MDLLSKIYLLKLTTRPITIFEINNNGSLKWHLFPPFLAKASATFLFLPPTGIARIFSYVLIP